MVGDFLRQPSGRYRNFQIVFTILTLNFAIPTLTYIFAPQLAQEQFAALNLLLGGEPYTFPEAQSRFWRYLGAANVATLALMCGLLQWNLRRFFPVLLPLTFMKSLAASLWLAGFVATPEFPAFLAAALLDFASSAAFVWFAWRAHSDIEDLSDDELWPRPSPLGSIHRDVTRSVVNAVIPGDVARLETLHEGLRRPAARKLRLGFDIAVVALAIAPVFSAHRRPLWRLEAAQQDAFVSRLAASPTWWVRQSVEIVKLVGCFAATPGRPLP